MVTSIVDNLHNILIMTLVLFAHYRLGRFFGATGLFTSSLFGLCASGIVVAIFANVNAAIISVYIKFSIALLLIWMTRSVLKTPFYNSLNFNWVVPMIFFAGLLILNPIEKTIFQTFGNNLYVFFNPHNSYLGIQSSEMISADYSSRLRVSNQYPLEWAGYHFFQSGVLAILRNFGSESLTLLSFLTSQVVLTAAAFASLFELYSKLFRKKVLIQTLFLFWVYLGFSFFRGTLNWQVVSNNSLTFWIIIFLVWAVACKNKNFIYLSSIVLMVSSIRFYPFVLLIFIYLFIVDNSYGLKRQIRKEWKTGFLFFIANLYTFLTISFPKPNFARIISEQVLSPGWHHNLFLYGFYERFADNLNISMLPKFDEGLAYTGLYRNFPSGTLQAKALSVFTIFMFLFFFTYHLYQIQKRIIIKKEIAIRLLMLISFILLLLKVSRSYSEIWAESSINFALLIVLPYILVDFAILQRLKFFQGNSYARPFLALWITLVLIQFTGANELKGPLAYATFDLVTWALIGLLMSNFLDLKVNKLIPLALVCAATIVAFPPRFDRIFIWPYSSFVSITNAKAQIKDIQYCVDLEPMQCDALGSVFGKRIFFNDKSWEFITFEFTLK